MIKAMRLLVTGGAGCLGAACAEQWLGRGVPVLVIDNFVTSDRASLAAHPLLEVVEGDIADAVLVQSCFSRFAPTHVIHSAAAYKDPDDWMTDGATNILGTVHVVRAAQAAGVSRLVHFQTGLCYGSAGVRPIPVDHPLAPTSSYAISKTAAEHYIALSGLPFVSLRLASVYGPRHFNGPIPTFYQRLKSGQTCFCTDTRRDFLAMEDFLDLMDRVMVPGAPTGLFNVGSGRDYTIKEIFDFLTDVLAIRLEKPVDVRPPEGDDVADFLLDPAETRAAFGWEARVPLAEGLRRQVAWFERHGVSQTYSHLRGPAPKPSRT